MIEIFKLSNSAVIREIGYEFPQIDTEWWEGVDYWGPESVSNTPLEGVISFKVIFPKFTLKENAKLTDMLSSHNIIKYLMVSERLFLLFKEFKMDDFQYFVEKVQTPQGSIDYYLVYLTTPRDTDFFDWENCVFYDVNDPERKTFSVPDAKAYYKATAGKVLKPDRIVVKPNQPAFDLFRCRFFEGGNRFYISSQLKNAMEAAKITGIRLDKMECYVLEEM